MAVRQQTWGPSPSSATDSYARWRDYNMSPISPMSTGGSRSPGMRPGLPHSYSQGSRSMSFTDSTSSGTPTVLPHGYLPFGSDRRHSYSNSDLHRMSNASERSTSIDATWEPAWGERPRSSTGYFPPTPGSVIPQGAAEVAGVSISPVYQNHRQSNTTMDVSYPSTVANGFDLPGLLKQWLSPIDFQLERLKLQKLRSQGTFDWLITSDGQYNRWLKSNTSESSVLWLCDRPGVGKSVATSLALQAVEAHCYSAKLSYAYVFGKRANKLNPTPQAIDFIKSLAFQIFKSHPVSIGQVPQGWEIYVKYSGQMPTMDQATEFLAEVLRGRRTYIVLDGIDECLQPSEVLEAILGLPTVGDGTTRVLVSSRMRPDAFDPDGLYPVIRLTPQNGSYSNDLRIFVEEEVSRIEGYHRGAERYTEAVSKVIAASDGNFLWASALLTDLKVAQIQGRFWETITTVPKAIQLVVKEELWKIWQKPESKRRLTLEVIEWTIFCMEPLTVGSFPFGRVFDSDGSFLDYEHRRIDRSRFLLRFGTEILIFPTLDGKFELFHHRLADYVLFTSMEENPQFQLTDGPTRLALSCVRYLSQPCFQDSLNSEGYRHTGLHSSQPGGAKTYLRSKFRCIEYASKHLVQHLLKVSDVTTADGSELVSTLITFFLSTNAVTWVEAGQIFDPFFARSFVNNCPELVAWVTSVVAVHPRWRESLPAVKARIEGLKRGVGSAGVYSVRSPAPAQVPAQISGPISGSIPPPAPGQVSRPRATTFDSPQIQVTSFPEERSIPVEPVPRARSRSPRGIGGLFTSLGRAPSEEPTRSPRRTREEIEQGVERRRSVTRHTFPLSNSEGPQPGGAISSALAVANVSATGAIPMHFHYPVRQEPVPPSSWQQQQSPYPPCQPNANIQPSHPQFSSTNAQPSHPQFSSMNTQPSHPQFNPASSQSQAFSYNPHAGGWVATSSSSSASSLTTTSPPQLQQQWQPQQDPSVPPHPLEGYADPPPPYMRYG